MAEITMVWFEEAGTLDDPAIKKVLDAREDYLALRYMHCRLALSTLQRHLGYRKFKRNCEVWEFLFNHLHKHVTAETLDAIYSLVVEHGGSCVRLIEEIARLKQMIDNPKETWS